MNFSTFKTDTQAKRIWAGLSLDRPRLMGVINVTPDSFSDGGQFFSLDAALAQAYKLIAESADILDIGGESTRPGAVPVSPEQEQDRVLPLIEALSQEPVRLSIDTRNASTARAAVAAGAHIWNDVTALNGDATSLSTALDLQVPLCLMHMQGQPQTMQAKPYYDQVVPNVRTHLLNRADALVTKGFDPSLLCLDVGIGFGKNLDHNLSLLKNLKQFTDLPFAHILGVSRKSYIDKAMTQSGHGSAPVNQRLPGSLATAVLALSNGCRMFRVHDIAETRQALTIAEQILTAP